MSTNNNSEAAIAEAKERMYEDLFHKATTGDITAFQRMKNLHKQEFDINWVDKDGDTFLMEASASGHANLVSFLLENGAIVDNLDKHGSSALCYAAAQNHVDTVRLLLEKGADSTCQPYNKEKHPCPLYYAAYKNGPEICDLLLKFGANLEQKFKGATSLQIATQEKHTNVIKILQAATAKKMEEKRKVIIANVAKAKLEQEKKEKLREEKEKMYEDLLANKARAGDIAAFQRMKSLPKQEFNINWSDKVNGSTFLMVGCIGEWSC